MGADRLRRSSHVRHRARLGAIIAALAGLVAVSSPVAACDVITLTHRGAEVICSAPANGKAGAARIDVRFGGFHDDSRVSITLAAAGQPLRCHPEDRTALSGEDGDEGEVVLSCRFDRAFVAGEADHVTVNVELHHAELAGVVWVADPAPAR